MVDETTKRIHVYVSAQELGNQPGLVRKEWLLKNKIYKDEMLEPER